MSAPGTSSLGSASLGGSVLTGWTFFSPEESLSQGVHRRSLTYNGNVTFFGVLIQMNFEPAEAQRVIRVYTHNDPGETPQLQVTGGDSMELLLPVGAAQFIVVDLEMLIEASQIGISITGVEM